MDEHSSRCGCPRCEAAALESMDAPPLFGKYHITKASGEPVDPEASYFVLRVDTDPAARIALAHYAAEVAEANPDLARDLRTVLDRCADTLAELVLLGKIASAAPEAR